MRHWFSRNTAKTICGEIFIFTLFLVPTFFLLPSNFYLLSPNLASAQTTQSATLLFSTPSAQVTEGQKFTVNVEVNSGGQSINAVSGTVSFPGNLVHAISLSTDNSIIKLWTQEPKLRANDILFEGVILNPGFEGTNGQVFSITFEAIASGTVNLNFNDGAILANNGLGTNVLASLGSANFNIIPAPSYASIIAKLGPTPTEQLTMIPVITKYFPSVSSGEVMYIGGKGEPNALTKIAFQNTSVKSLGEKFVEFFQVKKDTLGSVIVENTKNGNFNYISGKNLEAGVYNATPVLVNTNKGTDLNGVSVQFLVNDSVLVRDMVVLLNVLGLLIPIVILIVIIYFIPWYSWRRMRIMKDKMLLEEEKVELTAEELKEKSKNPTP
jgi:hypothetical protein